MPNFQNATLGVGTEVLVDGGDLGYTRGDITFTRDAETLPFETGIPIQTVGRTPLTDKWTANVPMGEITANNVSYAALNIPVTQIAGGAVSVAFGGTPAQSQVRTFASFAGGEIERIALDGGTVTNLVVKNAAEDVTYTPFDDYILDAITGQVYRNPNGAITSEQVVHVAYDYVAVAKERLKLGVNLPVATRSFKFTHVSPVSGRTIVVEFWKAQAQASFTLEFKEREYMVVNLVLESIPDTVNHADEPLGYVDFIPAA